MMMGLVIIHKSNMIASSVVQPRTDQMRRLMEVAVVMAKI